MVILTAFSQRDLIERARDAGAMAYLVKPFQKRDLLPGDRDGDLPVRRNAGAGGRGVGPAGAAGGPQADRAGQGSADDQARAERTEAFRWIQRAAMDNRTSMRAVAEVVLGETGHR